MRETWVQSLGWEDPLERERQPTPIFWPGEFHGLYSPRGCKESDRTKPLLLSLHTHKKKKKKTHVFSNNMLNCFLVLFHFLNRYRQSSPGREWVRREYYLVFRTWQSYWEKTRRAYSTGNYSHYLVVTYNDYAAAAKSLQSCLTLCDPIDDSPPGSSVPGILRARTLEWVAISFSNACVHAKSPQSCLTLCNPMDSSPPGSSVHRIL